jgi:hypothetical protein
MEQKWYNKGEVWGFFQQDWRYSYDEAIRYITCNYIAFISYHCELYRERNNERNTAVVILFNINDKHHHETYNKKEWQIKE